MGTGKRGAHRTGLAAEGHAAEVLRRAGYRILQRRYRARGGEVDLIASNRTHLVFVEVKARRSATFGAAAAAVTPLKQRRLARAARQYLREHGRSCRAVRFDVITLTGNGRGRMRVEWIVDAFYAS